MADPKDIIKKQSFQLDVDDNGGLPEAGKQQDIKKQQKVTLGEFLNKHTSKNVYKISSDIESNNSENSFDNDFSNDKTYSYSEYMSSAREQGQEEKVDTIKSKQQGTSENFDNKNSHNVLRTDTDNPYGSSILQGFNRFDIESRFRNLDQDGIPIQKRMGSYNPAPPKITKDRMEKIGDVMTKLSTGDAVGGGGRAGIDTTLGLGKTETLGFGGIIPASGWMLNDNELNPVAALEALVFSEGGNGSDPVLSEIKVNNLDTKELSNYRENDNEYYSLAKSSGNMTNSDQLFSGLFPLSLMVLHFALMLLSFALLQGLLLLFGSIAKQKVVLRNSQGKEKLGQHLSDKPAGVFGGIIDLVSGFFNIKSGMFDYDESVNQGLLELYGINTDNPLDILTAFENAATQPGYYATFSRMFFRSMNTVGATIERAAQGGTVESDINNVFAVIEAISNSKIIKMMNYFAIIGEKRIQVKLSELNSENKDYDGHSGINNLDKGKNPQPYQHRTYGPGTLYHGRLSMRTGNSRSALLVPDSILTDKNIPILVSRDKIEIKNNSARIDSKTREEIENSLEAEYVPFYFHDLRTNEIISFHAFLEDLNETYQPSYNSFTSMGRVEPIQTYTGTTRSITFNFSIISTNYLDFDIMYQKINKLITLLYPQYTKGQKISVNNGDGDVDMIMPFSQIPAASPMIRLRIGDLIKSNYSRFSLKRLFGFGTEGIGGKGAQFGESRGSSAANSQTNSILADVLFPDTKYLLRPTSDPVSSTYNSGYRIKEDGFGIGNPLGGLTTLVTQNFTKPDVYRVVVPEFVKVIESPQGERGDVVVESIDTKKRLIVKPKDLMPYEGTLTTSPAQTPSATINSSPDPTNLFDPTQNPVVRSFEENGGGKGLAGFITGFQISWESTWETQIYGSKSPKYCKISVTFSPVHDIAPGIDYNGYNRAPVYNVGRTANILNGDLPDEKNGGISIFNKKINKNRNS